MSIFRIKANKRGKYEVHKKVDNGLLRLWFTGKATRWVPLGHYVGWDGDFEPYFFETRDAAKEWLLDYCEKAEMRRKRRAEEPSYIATSCG